jgi:hypothetical protein
MENFPVLARALPFGTFTSGLLGMDILNRLYKRLPFGIFANDPYFDEILQRLRQERELDDENPAYT